MIPFTQFLRPDGRQVPVQVHRPADIEAKARAILAAGFVFECEQLITGHVSLTIANSKEDVAIEICHNDRAVLAAVDRLITRFNPETPQ